eukprot:353659-Chlamydomonas_euryale.AAC.3
MCNTAKGTGSPSPAEEAPPPVPATLAAPPASPRLCSASPATLAVAPLPPLRTSPSCSGGGRTTQSVTSVAVTHRLSISDFSPAVTDAMLSARLAKPIARTSSTLTPHTAGTPVPLPPPLLPRAVAACVAACVDAAAAAAAAAAALPCACCPRCCPG